MTEVFILFEVDLEMTYLRARYISAHRSVLHPPSILLYTVYNTMQRQHERSKIPEYPQPSKMNKKWHHPSLFRFVVFAL